MHGNLGVVKRGNGLVVVKTTFYDLNFVIYDSVNKSMFFVYSSGPKPGIIKF